MRRFAPSFFALSFSALLSGCVLNILEPAENANRIFDNSATVPTSGRDFTGFVQVGDNIANDRVTAWMERRCSEIASGNYTVGSRWKGTAGPYSTPIYYKSVSKPGTQVISSPGAVVPLTAPVSPSVLINSNSLTEAKMKCAQIGFTEGTEGFGKCVLQLSK